MIAGGWLMVDAAGKGESLHKADCFLWAWHCGGLLSF